MFEEIRYWMEHVKVEIWNHMDYLVWGESYALQYSRFWIRDSDFETFDFNISNLFSWGYDTP